jgi:hypothetical protein
MSSFQFTLDNFKEHSQRLQVIIMSRQNYDPMTNFKTLEPKQKRLFNIELNNYINTLREDFEETITQDFNRVAKEEIFPFINTKYKNMVVRASNEEELGNETKEYKELIFKNEMLDNKLTETQLKKIPIIDN